MSSASVAASGRVGRSSVLLLGAVGVAAGLAVEVGGRGAFPTHPVSTIALAASALGVWIVRERAPERLTAPLTALTVALLAYLWLGVAACATEDRLVVGAWAAGWIPVNGLLTVLGLAGARLVRSAWAVAAWTGTATVAAAAISRPTAPFTGVATVEPEDWSVRLSPLAEALVGLTTAIMVGAVVVVAVTTVRAHVIERRHLVTCLAAVSTAPGLVLACYALAILHDPGEIDPATGSTAYVTAIGICAFLAAWSTSTSWWPSRLVAASWAWGLVVVAGLLASTSVTHPTLRVVIASALALVVTCATAAGTWWLERWTAVPPPVLVRDPFDALSARENEVLAWMAEGATNAGIAANLHLSERTVEQHLRSIFTKLDLGSHDSSNRRVRAAALWWRHQGTDAAGDATA